MSEKLISIKKAAELLGTDTKTLRRWDTSGKLKSTRTAGGHRRYRLSDIEKLQGISAKEDLTSEVAIYCRVSSHDQKKKGDLDRQKSRLLDYCIKNNLNVRHCFEEVGSGMNPKRSKLKSLFKVVISNEISKVIIEHKDRLTRFNFEFLEEFFKSHQVQIVWVEEVLNKSFEEELVKDILTLMSSFSNKIYGKRSATLRKKSKK